MWNAAGAASPPHCSCSLSETSQCGYDECNTIKLACMHARAKMSNYPKEVTIIIDVHYVP